MNTNQRSGEGQFLTTAEIVKATGTTPATVTRWVAAGKLSPIHKGQGIRGAFLFAREDVDAFLAERNARKSAVRR